MFIYPTAVVLAKGKYIINHFSCQGADPEGVLGVRATSPPPTLLGDPQTSERGKKRCVYTRILCILVLNSYTDPPPPFRNPVSIAVVPCLTVFIIWRNSSDTTTMETQRRVLSREQKKTAFPLGLKGNLLSCLFSHGFELHFS